MTTYCYVASVLKNSHYILIPSPLYSNKKFSIFLFGSRYLLIFVKHGISIVSSLSILKLMCRQCGKTFDPNQLHKHMISCRGMKALAKAAAAAAATTPANTSSYSHRRSTDSPRQPSIFKPLLD